MRSQFVMSCRPVKTQPFQIRLDRVFQFRRFGALGVQFADEALHLFLEGFFIVLDFLGPDIAAWSQDVAVCGNFGGGGGFAEARHVSVRSWVPACAGMTVWWVPAPCMVSVDDLCNVGVGQFAMNAVDVRAEFAGVDEESFAAMIAGFTPGLTSGARLFVFRQEPQTDRNLRALEQLTGQSDHAVYEIRLDEGFAEIAFAGFQLRPVLFKRVRDVLQKDQPEHHMLVLGRVHVVPQLISRQPQLGFESEIGSAGISL